jgi:putative heme-binding domain-containing protein
LLYVVRMALRDQLLLAAAWDTLPLKPWTESDAQAVADVSLGVHSPDAAAYLMRTIPSQPGDRDFLTSAVHEIARYGAPETTKTLLIFVRGYHVEDLGLQFALFREVQHGLEERKATLDDDARAWAVQLTDKLLASKQAAEVKSGIEMVGVLKLEGLQSRLALLATDRATPEDQRAAALKALRDVDAVRNAAVLGRVLNDAEAPAALRDQTATLLAEANQAETQAELLQALPTAPAHLQNVIAAGLSNSRNGAEKLLDAIETGKASARLLQERIVEVRLADKDVKDRVVKLTKGLKPAEQAIQELIAKRRQGFDAAKPDLAVGAKLFEKNCAICHQLGGKGAKVGPQLDGVGIRGLDRLLEDVLDPNRNVDQAFRLTTLLLKKGGVVSGLLLREEGEVLVMADAQGKEMRVPKGEVDERAVSPQSPMPADFADKVSETDFYHLMGFLLTLRVKDAPKPGGG